MRIAVANTQSPFIQGGAESLAEGLVTALRAAGHEAELVTLPFRFHPPEQVRRSMEIWAGERFDRFDCGPIDAVVCLRFPSYYLHHPNRVVWLLHQHRAVYELYGTEYGPDPADRAMARLRSEIVARDTESLGRARAVYTIGRRVSDRLLQYNGVRSTPLHHPPPNASRYRSGEALPYIFAPSRLEALKRQDLLIRALRYVRSPVAAIIAGEGGRRPEMERLVARYGVGDRVRFIGRVDVEELVSWYANALAIFFGPFDEDYGYVALEAMLSSKPVITCTDSGGPTEFVLHEETGFVVEPEPEQVAAAIDRLYGDRAWARKLGVNARERYTAMGLCWRNVVEALTGAMR